MVDTLLGLVIDRCAKNPGKVQSYDIVSRRYKAKKIKKEQIYRIKNTFEESVYLKYLVKTHVRSITIAAFIRAVAVRLTSSAAV